MRILLAIDDSKSAAAPVREAAIRTWPEGSVVRVLTVLEPIAVPAFVPEAPILPSSSPLELRAIEDQANAMVASVARMMASRGLVAECIVREGTAGRTIVEEAREWGADLILIGTQGRTGLSKLLMGSVAQYVSSHAHCSVEVVRGSREEERHADAP